MTTLEKILTTAQRLFVTEGYGKTSVQMIIKEVGIAKGTFYHYFKSKEALMDTLVNTAIDQQTRWMSNQIMACDGSAIEKLNLFFKLQNQWKGQEFDLLYSVLQVMSSDENILFVKRNQEKNIDYYGPLMTHIIKQGVAEGVFHTPYPEAIAEMIIRLSNSMSEEMVTLFVAYDQHDQPFELLKEKIAVFTYSIGRLIEFDESSKLIELIDFNMIKNFFDYLEEKGRAK